MRSFKPGSISAAELRSLADSLRRQSPAAAYRHAALLQLAEAAAAALEGPHAGELEIVWLDLKVNGLEHATLLVWLSREVQKLQGVASCQPCPASPARYQLTNPTTPAIILPPQSAGRRCSASSASCSSLAPSLLMQRRRSWSSFAPLWRATAAAAAAGVAGVAAAAGLQRPALARCWVWMI